MKRLTRNLIAAAALAACTLSAQASRYREALALLIEPCVDGFLLVLARDAATPGIIVLRVCRPLRSLR